MLSRLFCYDFVEEVSEVLLGLLPCKHRGRVLLLLLFLFFVSFTGLDATGGGRSGARGGGGGAFRLRGSGGSREVVRGGGGGKQ